MPEPWSEEDDPRCHATGRCTAPVGASGCCSCRWCGKELVQRDGAWHTWDASQVRDPQPQHSDSTRIQEA